MIDAGQMGVPSTNSTKNRNNKVITLKAKSSLEFYSLKSKATLLHSKNNKHIKNSAKKPKGTAELNIKKGGPSPKKRTSPRVQIVPKSKLQLNKELDP